MKLKKWLQTNSLFLRVISVAVAGVILATILITWISIQTLQKNYLKTFRNANQIFTEQINTDMTEFYAETATVMQTVRESWAFRRYFGMLDMSTAEASYTIYSMKRQIDAIQSNQLKQTIRIIAIGRNGRSFISGESSLSISQEEILNSTFTKSIREANGKPVVQYVENGLSTIAKGKGAYVIGSSLTYSNSTIPYGYVYAVIPLDTMSGFDIRYTGAASELFLLDTQGTVLAAPDSDLIGTKQPELLQNARKKTEKISYNGTTCSVVYSYQPQLHCYIMSLIDQEQILRDAHIFRNAILVSTCICIGLMIPMFILINHSVQPIYRLIRRMSKTKDGQLDLTSKIEESGSYEIKELSHVYNILLDDINRYINQLVEEQSNRRKAEIHALQMQINPHFIYNTLTTIKWLIWQGETEKSVKSIDAFIMILRNTISNKNEIISVAEEAKNLENYMFLLHTRFSEQIHTDIFIAESCESLSIPKLLVQPFVENAFYHAFSETTSGLIHVFFRKKENDLIIEVVDNGSGMKLDDAQKNRKESFTGIGIHNVDDRIHLIYGQEYGVSIQSNLGNGTRITITIPAIPYQSPETDTKNTADAPKE